MATTARAGATLLGVALALAAAGAAPLAGCASDSGPHAPARGRAAQAPQGEPEAPEGRLLVRTAASVVAVADVPEAVAAASAVTERLGGQVRGSHVEQDAPARLELRVPAARLPEALDAFAALGEERSRSLRSSDVTDAVGDAEAELANRWFVTRLFVIRE